jgi:hypothetical protein
MYMNECEWVESERASEHYVYVCARAHVNAFSLCSARARVCECVFLCACVRQFYANIPLVLCVGLRSIVRLLK